jgi:tRNA A-37 threonylcarbamoyl transferase component Bud32/ABC-type transporter Mla MlaB component
MAERRRVDPLIGSFILDQYRVLRVLARGGMSEVYLAEQAPMDRLAVVKVVRNRGDQTEAAVKRFRREARAASRLSHPNVVTVYNFGQLADGSLFLAMEHVEGVSLGRVLASGALPVHRVVELGMQCASALAFAHSVGVIHRDVKPENVMVTEVSERDLVKLLDFGIARLTEGASQTKAGVLLGTPQYMSPEQCRGETATEHSDQYALGLVLYEMATGRVAVESDSVVGYMYRHQHVVPPPPSRFRPTSGAVLLDPIVLRMLAKAPEERFPDLGVVVEELGRVAERLDIPADEPPICRRYLGEDVGRTLRDPTTEGFAATAPALPQAVLLGPAGVLSPDADGGLGGGLLELRGHFPKPAPAVAEIEPLTVRVLRLPERGWEEIGQEWGGHNTSPDRLLACVDAPVDSPRLAAVVEQFDKVLVAPHPVDPAVLATAVRWIHLGVCGGLECVDPGQPIQVFQITSSSEKSEAVDALLENARAEGVRYRCLQSLAQIAEEMIMNAVFHAPVDATGAPRYSHLPRYERVVLRQGEEPALRWMVGPRFVALSIMDAFGSLPGRLVAERVTGERRAPDLDASPRGAGVGLQIMSRLADHLFFGVNPGTWCEIVALVQRDPTDVARLHRSLGVLQRVGQRTYAVGDRLRLFESRHHGVIRLELSGEVNETADLERVFQQRGIVHLDLGAITQISSAGVAAWLEAQRRRSEDLSLVFHRCSQAMVEQLNKVPALVELVDVSSILVPYRCTGCGRETTQACAVEHLPPQTPPPCAECHKDLAPDVPETYFAFRSRLPL